MRGTSGARRGGAANASVVSSWRNPFATTTSPIMVVFLVGGALPADSFAPVPPATFALRGAATMTPLPFTFEGRHVRVKPDRAPSFSDGERSPDTNLNPGPNPNTDLNTRLPLTELLAPSLPGS